MIGPEARKQQVFMRSGTRNFFGVPPSSELQELIRQAALRDNVYLKAPNGELVSTQVDTASANSRSDSYGIAQIGESTPASEKSTAINRIVGKASDWFSSRFNKRS